MLFLGPKDMNSRLFEHSIVTSFPDLHPEANLEIGFQLNLRRDVNDLNDNHLPGFGWLPVAYVGDYYKDVPIECSPDDMILPLYQSEAMSIYFNSNFIKEHNNGYPFAIKIDFENFNAINGRKVTNSLNDNPKNYITNLEQSVFESYIEENNFHQFIAPPLGLITSENSFFQKNINNYSIYIQIVPLKQELFNVNFPVLNNVSENNTENEICAIEEIIPLIVQDEQDSEELVYGVNDENIKEDENDYVSSDWDNKLSKKLTIHVINTHFWQNYLADKLIPREPIKYKHYKYFDISWLEQYNEEYSFTIGNQ